MALSCPLQGRLTTGIHYEAMEKAFQAGADALADHLAATKGLRDSRATALEGFEVPEDMWKFDPRPRKEGKVDRANKKPTPKWVDDPELADLDFNPEHCNCRKWNGGFGAQCNREKLEDDVLCALHKKNYDRIIEEGGDDPAYIIHALGIIARAKNMSQLARDTGLSREGLYKALSEEGNPTFAAVTKVAKALGLEIKFQPAA